MKRFSYIAFLCAAAVIFAACEAPAGNSPAANANTANANTAKPAAAAPTLAALMTLEKSAYEAWKNKDAKFWDEFLAANFVGFGSTGKLDKTSATKEYTGTDCEVKSYALSDEQMTLLGADAAMITYKTTVDATCSGQKLPAQGWAAGIYVRDGEKWKGTFHAETPIVDPKAAPAKAAAPKTDKTEVKPADAKPDAATDAVMALEKKAWEAWKVKDQKGLDDWAADGMVSLSGGAGRTDKAASVKRWMEDKCEIKTISLNDAASLSLGSDFSLLTFKADVDGKCGGESLTPEFGATVYAKQDGVWKALFTMGSPAA